MERLLVKLASEQKFEWGKHMEIWEKSISAKEKQMQNLKSRPVWVTVKRLVWFAVEWRKGIVIKRWDWLELCLSYSKGMTWSLKFFFFLRHYVLTWFKVYSKIEKLHIVPCSYTRMSSPIINITHRNGCYSLLHLMNLHDHIVITQSP